MISRRKAIKVLAISPAILSSMVTSWEESTGAKITHIKSLQPYAAACIIFHQHMLTLSTIYDDKPTYLNQGLKTYGIWQDERFEDRYAWRTILELDEAWARQHVKDQFPPQRLISKSLDITKEAFHANPSTVISIVRNMFDEYAVNRLTNCKELTEDKMDHWMQILTKGE